MDPYLIPNTDVLKNKLGITEKEELDRAEAFISQTKLFDADEKVKGNFDYKHLMNLHQYILGDVYDWAGQPRLMDIEKAERVLSGLSVKYSTYKNIPNEIESAINEFKKVKWSDLNTYEQKAEVFSKNMARLWQVHPFREGNTRTVTEFCVQYAATQNIFIDKQLFAQNAKFTRDALVMASIGEYSDFSHLNRLVKDAIEKGDKQRINSIEIDEQTKSTLNNMFSLKGVKNIDIENKEKQHHPKKEKKHDRTR